MASTRLSGTNSLTMQRLLEVSDEIHGSLAELIKNIDSSLDDCTVTVNDRMYFEVRLKLYCMSSHTGKNALFIELSH